jgi:serine acetyltransferase
MQGERPVARFAWLPMLSDAPVLMDHVDVGANAVIVGPVTVWQGAVAGAGTVVI